MGCKAVGPEQAKLDIDRVDIQYSPVMCVRDGAIERSRLVISGGEAIPGRIAASFEEIKRADTDTEKSR